MATGMFRTGDGSVQVTPLEVAEHILEQAASGKRDLDRLKSSAPEKLSTAT